MSTPKTLFKVGFFPDATFNQVNNIAPELRRTIFDGGTLSPEIVWADFSEPSDLVEQWLSPFTLFFEDTPKARSIAHEIVVQYVDAGAKIFIASSYVGGSVFGNH